MKIKTTVVCAVDENVFSAAMLINRLLCAAAAGYFVFGILLNFRASADIVALKANIGVTPLIIVAESFLFAAAALSFLLGYRTKITALVLMFFTVLNGFIFYGSDANNFFIFFILATLAALTPAAVLGPGKYSLDFKKAERDNSKFLSK